MSQRLDAEAQAVTRDKLLRRERGTKIGIVLPDQCQNGTLECLAMLVVARATAFAGTQRRCAISSERTTQPENLTPAQTHQRRGGLDCDPAVCQVDHDTKPGQFLTAHLNHRHRTSPRTSRRQLASVTFLSVTRVTFLSVTYSKCPSPFEKSQILPVRNVTPCKVEMAPPPGGGHASSETASLPNAG